MEHYKKLLIILLIIGLAIPFSSDASTDEEYKKEVEQDLLRSQKENLAEGVVITFASPVTLKLKAGTVFANIGSKAVATVSPNDYSYGQLKQLLSCKYCLIPNAKDSDLVHYIEMLSDIRILSDIILKVECEFCGYTYGQYDASGKVKQVRKDDSTVRLYFEKGSPMPEVLKSGECPKAKSSGKDKK